MSSVCPYGLLSNNVRIVRAPVELKGVRANAEKKTWAASVDVREDQTRALGSKQVELLKMKNKVTDTMIPHSLSASTGTYDELYLRYMLILSAIIKVIVVVVVIVVYCCCIYIVVICSSNIIITDINKYILAHFYVGTIALSRVPGAIVPANPNAEMPTTLVVHGTI